MTDLVTQLYEKQLMEDLDEVRSILDSITGEAPGIIRKEIRKLVSENGKMLRPSFTILAGRYGNFKGDRIYRLAAAVELLHNATLIHDDIIDEAKIRRGNPAIHTIHGNKLAILAGDYLFSNSFIIASENSQSQQYNKIARAISGICEGEILQDAAVFSMKTSVREYKRRIASKTAILFSLSLYLGAEESGCSAEDCSTFTKIGYNIGMAFQIIDDILDITGSQKVIGKPAGNDIKEGIFTLPIILALLDDDGQLRKLLRRYPYSSNSLKKILSMVYATNGIERSRRIAESYTARAVKEIDRLDDGYTKSQLSAITEKLLTRDY